MFSLSRKCWLPLFFFFLIVFFYFYFVHFTDYQKAKRLDNKATKKTDFFFQNFVDHFVSKYHSLYDEKGFILSKTTINVCVLRS